MPLFFAIGFVSKRKDEERKNMLHFLLLINIGGFLRREKKKRNKRKEKSRELHKMKNSLICGSTMFFEVCPIFFFCCCICNKIKLQIQCTKFSSVCVCVFHIQQIMERIIIICHAAMIQLDHTIHF